MNQKTRKISYTVVVVITAVIIGGGAIAKLAGLATAPLVKVGVGDYVKILGGSEIILLLLFLYRKTFKVGLILLCCYFGGAIATQLSHHNGILPPVIPLLLVWLAAVLRDRSVFLPGSDPSF
jgi:hypothetical protein